MWIVIGAVALFIVYLVIKKQSEKTDSNKTEATETEISLEKTLEVQSEPVVKQESEKKEAAPKKPAAAKKPAAEKAEPAADGSEYATQHKALSTSNKKAKEFSLFDTKAAFFWNEGDSKITLLSITAFVKGAAKSTAYGSYSFDLTDWVWDGDQPKGCATEIKKHLSENFKKGETA